MKGVKENVFSGQHNPNFVLYCILGLVCDKLSVHPREVVNCGQESHFVAEIFGNLQER